MVTDKLEVNLLLKKAKKVGILREEIYDPRAPAHWPKDRCFRMEYDDEFAKRIKRQLAAKLS
jgi:hypothetical protein